MSSADSPRSDYSVEEAREGRQARLRLRAAASREHRKALGQFFTPPDIAVLAAALTLQDSTTSVLDPTCGEGVMLWAARERLASLGPRPAELVGVEVDAQLARLAQLPPHERHAGKNKGPLVRIHSGDIFRVTAGGTLRGVSGGGFDALVGNPPYVRNQQLPAVVSAMWRDEFKSLLRLRPRMGAVAASHSLLRCCLIAHLVDAPFDDAVSFLTEATELISSNGKHLEDSVDKEWVQLVGSYPAIADLSVPVWLLTWVLAAPDARIAFVSSNSVLNRDYGAVLRRFMVRFLKPLAVVTQPKAWFEEAQVDASLMVFRRRSVREMASDQGESVPSVVPLIELRSALNIGTVHRLSRLLDEPLNSDLAAFSDDDFAVRCIPELEVFREGPRAKPSPATQGQNPVTDAKRRLRQPAAVREMGPVVPSDLHEALVGPDAPGVASLSDYGVVPGQGLRTGYNPFFLLDVQSGASDRHEEDETSVLVAGLGGKHSARMPTRWVWPIARYQRSITTWSLEETRAESVALVTDLGYTSRDARTIGRYPRAWVEHWRREGLRQLADSVSRYIHLADVTLLSSTPSRIRDLSAVRTNRFMPPVKQVGEEVPSAPRGWHSLRIAERHFAPIFMSRIVHERTRAHFNCPRKPWLIDANFSTFRLDLKAPISRDGLLALLNSSWVATTLELIASPMGGGALKVEATHLRRMPLPRFNEGALRRLHDLGRTLRRRRLSRSPAVLAEIDRVVVGAFGVTDIQTSAHRMEGLRERAASIRMSRRIAASKPSF